MLLYTGLNCTGIARSYLLLSVSSRFLYKRRALQRKIEVHAVTTDYYLWVTRTFRYLLNALPAIMRERGKLVF